MTEQVRILLLSLVHSSFEERKSGILRPDSIGFLLWRFSKHGECTRLKIWLCEVRVPQSPLGNNIMTTIKLGSRGEDVKILQGRLNLLQDGIFGPLTQEAVKEFQQSKGLVPDGIVGANTWVKLGVSTNNRNITEIIVHCSATPEGRDYTVDTIKGWHLQRGFSDIGYHYVIYRDGSVHVGRSESIAGAHCTGHNTISIGICYIGGMDSDNKYPKDTRTRQQKDALLRFLKELKRKYPKAKIYSHKDFAAKACPSFDATKEYALV